MQMKHALLLVVALSTAGAAPATAAQGAQAVQQYHVVEVHNSKTTSAEALMDVLTEKLGAPKDKVQQLLEKLKEKGKAVMVVGPEVSCKEAAKEFVNIGMKAVVRPIEPHMHGAKNWVQLYTTTIGRKSPKGILKGA